MLPSNPRGPLTVLALTLGSLVSTTPVNAQGRCTADEECQRGATCEEVETDNGAASLCFREDLSCATDADCPEPLGCNEPAGKCEYYFEACSSDEDCSPNYSCTPVDDKERCWSPDLAPADLELYEAADGLLCYQAPGICMPTPAGCQTSDECSDGWQCVELLNGGPSTWGEFDSICSPEGTFLLMHGAVEPNQESLDAFLGVSGGADRPPVSDDDGMADDGTDTTAPKPAEEADTETDGSSVPPSGATDEQSGATDEQSGATDEQSGATDEQSGATDEQSEATDEQSEATDEQSRSNGTQGEPEVDSGESGTADAGRGDDTEHRAVATRDGDGCAMGPATPSAPGLWAALVAGGLACWRRRGRV